MGLSDEERALRLMKLLDMRSQMRRRQFLRYMMAATASAVVLGACGDGSGSASSNGGSGDTASSGSSDASDEVLVRKSPVTTTQRSGKGARSSSPPGEVPIKMPSGRRSSSRLCG